MGEIALVAAKRLQRLFDGRQVMSFTELRRPRSVRVNHREYHTVWCLLGGRGR